MSTDASRGARRAGLRAALAAVAVVAVVATTPLTAAPASGGLICDALPDDPALDCTPPDTVITLAPPATTDVDAAAFEFTTVPDERGATFECSLTGPAPQAHGWGDCTTPTSGGTASRGAKVYTDLPLGAYTFSVRATDEQHLVGGGNLDATPATYAWTVLADLDGPDSPGDPSTRITSGAKRWHLYPFLGLTYAADEPTLGFRCTLDAEERSCSNDAGDGDGRGQAGIFGMGPRDHRFTVTAVDVAGNVDPTPAVERWTVPYDSAGLAHYSEGWKRLTGRGHFQETWSVTTRKGASVAQGHRGFRSAALVTTRCPGCGTIAVHLGSRLIGTYDLRSPTRRQMQVIELGSWRKRRSGTIEVVVTSSGKDVVVDGLGFSRRR